jgi:predicted helicase
VEDHISADSALAPIPVTPQVRPGARSSSNSPLADTHGIVYTPQPIVDFMVRSVDDILKKEFGKSLADKGVHILDPFVGTGNFITRTIRQIGETRKSALPHKFEHELHCNEIMLLPYYIASMNIEHEYMEQTGQYKPFEGICLVDIFHYTYALLHSPDYRERYAANLKRELPRIPYAPDFRAFATAGQRLAELHVNYEQQPEYPLERIENPNVKQLSYRVEKMRLGRDKSSIFYNELFTLSGIPPETYEYRLGNRSALEWVIDQYQVSTDKRSGITNDPNREDDPEYILRLIGQVIYVSLETVKIVNSLPRLGIEE